MLASDQQGARRGVTEHDITSSVGKSGPASRRMGAMKMAIATAAVCTKSYKGHPNRRFTVPSPCIPPVTRIPPIPCVSRNYETKKSPRNKTLSSITDPIAAYVPHHSIPYHPYNCSIPWYTTCCRMASQPSNQNDINKFIRLFTNFMSSHFEFMNLR